MKYKYTGMEETVVGAVGAVLLASSHPTCSLILLTDGISPSSTILRVKYALYSLQGLCAPTYRPDAL